MRGFAKYLRLGVVVVALVVACLALPYMGFAVEPNEGNVAPGAGQSSTDSTEDDYQGGGASGNTERTGGSSSNVAANTSASNTAANTAAGDALPTDGQKMVSSTNTAAQHEKDKQTLQEGGGPGPIDLGDGNFVNPMQLPDSSFIYDITIADLAKADSYLSGQTVQVVGEVVGDKIHAELDPDYCWIVLADSSGNTVSVYMPTESAKVIDTFGRYGQTGTTLQVRGVFTLACGPHQGQTDIHSAHINVVRKGEIHRDKLVWENFIPGAVVVGVGLVMLFVYWRLRERLR